MELTPKQIIIELDRYIIGQQNAKRAVAVALRNRYRRSMLQEDVREEITPKNIIMKGPTGVGKTEIARRLSKLVRSPFLKVEATKFTEVGYVGRDVESMVRDLVEASIRLVKEEKFKEIEPRAMEAAHRKMVDALYIAKKRANQDRPEAELRQEIADELKEGKLDGVPVEVEIDEAPKQLQLGPMGGNGGDNNIGDFLGSIMPKKRKKKRTNVKRALEFFAREEANKLMDTDSIEQEALHRAEQDGIIFIDEMDKIASKGKSSGPDVSREGVQRDILPIVEGCTVNTKYGNIKTDFILFIAAGAFQIAKVSDLIPELQGRFPVLVELDSLTEEDFVKILTEPDNAIIMQYSALLGVDGVKLKFTDNAIAEMAKFAYVENETKENIGARRLQTVMEMLLEKVSFEADGSNEEYELVVDRDYVIAHLDIAIREQNLKKYII